MKLKEIFESIAEKTNSIVNIEIIDSSFYKVVDFELGAKHYYHHSTYCHFAKLNGNQPNCAKNKARSKQIARYGRLFSGRCPFGVWDLAQPIFYRDRLLAIVYLGGFKAENHHFAKINGLDYHGPELPSITPGKIRKLKYYANFIREYATLAYSNWISAGNEPCKQKNLDYYQEIILKFIEARFNTQIKLADLAENLDLNPNYLGKIIARIFGKNFNSLLNDIRIKQAKVHLSSETSKTISQIAYQCGFNDSNYFSTVFRKKVGCSPRKYRKTLTE